MLEKLRKYEIDRKALSEIRGSGEGTVVCANGESFSASASSFEAVQSGGERWCRDHGHGPARFIMYVGD